MHGRSPLRTALRNDLEEGDRNRPRDTLHEVEDNHLEEDLARLEVGESHILSYHSNHHEVENGDDSRPDEGCIHEEEALDDRRSSHHWEAHSHHHGEEASGIYRDSGVSLLAPAILSIHMLHVKVRVGTNICSAVDSGALKFTVVELLDSSLQVRGSLKLNETANAISRISTYRKKVAYPLPSRSRPTSE